MKFLFQTGCNGPQNSVQVVTVIYWCTRNFFSLIAVFCVLFFILLRPLRKIYPAHSATELSQ